MTTAKRALIVDDSRSARVILSRMLEQHGLVVDTAESAEQALDYLQRTRPDVIFMDHLMPGMDGFQAVQAIKADALTATIPLMMYTSQEGELYVSQARALGAVGVLPKTVRPVDVSRVLYQLHLLPDRRAMRTALFPGPAAAAAQAASSGFGTEASMAAALAADAEVTPAAGDTASTGARPVLAGSPLPADTGVSLTAGMLSELQVGLRASMHQMVKDQLAEQRRFMLATFEAFARRLTGEVKEAMAKVPAPPAPQELIPPEPPRQWWPVAVTALLAVVPAAVLGFIAWQASITNRALAQDLAEARSSLERARAEAAVATAAATAASAAATVASTEPLPSAPASVSGMTVTEYVPYGEAPLGGTRLDRLRAIAGTLEAQRFRGTIRVESFVGDFCLAGSASEGFALAAVDLAVSKCDLVGNPFDDSLSPAQRQSLDFANFAAALRQRTGGAIRVDVSNAGRSRPIEYPEQDEKTTAGAWNIVAAQNNRVEFHVVPEA
jgi:CheY-like chemotaxis protein